MMLEPQGRNFVFEEGMVFTVEPGIYIGEEGIGIRIEDDVLVTEDGCKVLTKNMIKEVEDIEEFMKIIKNFIELIIIKLY